MPQPTDSEQRIRELSASGDLEAAHRVALDWVAASADSAEAHNALGKNEARLTLGAWSSFYAPDLHHAWLERLATLGALTPRLQRMREAVARLRTRTVRT